MLDLRRPPRWVGHNRRRRLAAQSSLKLVSSTTRSLGTVQISECTAALTSAHHAAAAALAACRSNGLTRHGGLGQQRHHQIGLDVAAEVSTMPLDRGGPAM